MISAPWIDDREILAVRPGKNLVDPWRPYAFLVEPEYSAAGVVEDVATVFLTNRECPFHCLMCDLWRNTLDTRVPDGAIPAQIDYALERLPPARHIKLYNSANFFDPQAIPRNDWPAIAARLKHFQTVIVENHPRLVTADCRAFQELIGTQLEVALGLETIHPEVLPRLNKHMTLADFESAVQQLRGWDIQTRAFILLRPPYLTEGEGIDWACRSIAYAFDYGIQCCSVIPVRGGNGIMERLQSSGLYEAPSLSALEAVSEFGLRLVNGERSADRERSDKSPLLTNGGQGGLESLPNYTTNRPSQARTASARKRVFVDLWDVERFATCPACGPQRRARLQRMNLSQELEPTMECQQCR